MGAAHRAAPSEKVVVIEKGNINMSNTVDKVKALGIPGVETMEDLKKLIEKAKAGDQSAIGQLNDIAGKIGLGNWEELEEELEDEEDPENPDDPEKKKKKPEGSGGSGGSGG
jgi:hypothetical protein